MYLNKPIFALVLGFVRLTLTWDVFKLSYVWYNCKVIHRLTLTWDVFK